MFTHCSVQKVVWNTKDQTYLRALRSFKGAFAAFWVDLVGLGLGFLFFWLHQRLMPEL